MFGILRFQTIYDINIILFLLLVLRWRITHFQKVRTPKNARTLICKTSKTNALSMTV